MFTRQTPVFANKLFIKDCILYATIYGCSKQNRCVNEIWLLYVLKFTDIVMIERLINSPGNNRSKIDGINGTKKTCLRHKKLHNRHWRI